jgi:proteic killer suppression protein
MIKSFRSKALQRFFEKGDARRLSVQNPERIKRMLLTLEAASAPESMNVPGWRFHSLSGDRKGSFAVSASGNWRITFGWNGKDATDVDLEDYH